MQSGPGLRSAQPPDSAPATDQATHPCPCWVIEKRQADCDSGSGHLLAIIKPKIVRHTIILTTNNLFLLTPPTSPSGRLANPAVINLSIRSSRSLASTFRVIFLLWRRARSMHSLMILQHDR